MNHHNTLLRVKQLFEEALPKFNWGDSFLDADAIKLLNEVPMEVNRALASISRDRTECLIPGCALELEGGTSYAWGDLHIQGDRFIFNAAVDKYGCTVWSHPPANSTEGRRALRIPVGQGYFERRGVLITKASRALLNANANAYTSAESIPS